MIEVDNGSSVSAKIGNETFKTTLKTDTHTVISDEPAELGGLDMGPSPGDLLRMSLASCTAITLRMYANRKNWEVNNIHVQVWSERVAEKTVFHVTLEIDGNVNDAQRARMLQIGKACPIHKLLTNSIDVELKLV